MPVQDDLVVVGGGAAGLAGAIVLARSRQRVPVIDAGAPRNARADWVHTYLSREGTPPAELFALGRADVTGDGGEVISRQVTALRRVEDGKEIAITLADGREVQARRLLITTGATDTLPDTPGLAEHWGHDVQHCPFCHGKVKWRNWSSPKTA